MGKRKASESVGLTDFVEIAQKFDTFVASLADLLAATPEHDCLPNGTVDNDVKERVQIAQILKCMQDKGQLRWMKQYLKNDETSTTAKRPLLSTDTAASKDPAPYTLGNVVSMENELHKETRSQAQSEKQSPNAFKRLDFDSIAREAKTSKRNEMPPLPRIHSHALLNQAFTHRSYATACAPPRSSTVFLTSLHNERLEFLGDSFLNHSVTKMLFAQLPEAREGEMSLLRAELIGNTTAAEFGRQYGFDKQLLLNDTAERDGVRKTPKVIADTFEAYLGALFLDGKDGMRRADDWVKALMAPKIKKHLAEKVHEPIDTFAKQRVWNHFVKINPMLAPSTDGVERPVVSISYDWVDGGGGNEGGFVVAAKLTDPTREIHMQELGRGFGLRKKDAEHRAAMDAARKLGI